MKLLSKTLIALSFVGATSFAIATTVANQTETTEQATIQPAINHLPEPVINTLNQAETINQNAISATAVTVKQALNLSDDTHVQLKGRIVKSLGDEKYQFRDQTGVMTVDIDDDLWMGKAISATTEVTIEGEVDIDYKPMKRVEIDVNAVRF